MGYVTAGGPLPLAEEPTDAKQGPLSASCPKECVVGLTVGGPSLAAIDASCHTSDGNAYGSCPAPGGRLFGLRVWRAKALGLWACPALHALH